MKILDVLTSAWSIRPEKMAEIRNIYHAHLRGPKIDWKDMQAAVGLPIDPRENEKSYQYMKGVLTKGLSFFSFLFGGASMKQIAIAFQAALDDPLVKSILLDVDSPGGTVDGTEELAEAIFQARGQKPIIAYSDGMMASGAYWIASAADKIYISGDTVMVGSIGVVATHVDQSKQDEAYGEKWTEITAGRYKRIASGHRPLTEEGASYIQDQVDYLYSKFVDTVARNRDANHESALAMADGKIFLGWQAVTIGLVDGVEAFSDLINSKLEAGAPAVHQISNETEETIMNIEELKTKHPDVYTVAVAEGEAKGKTDGIAEGSTAGKAAGIEEGKALGAAAERQRIADVRAQLIPGHEVLIDQLVADGKTTGPEAAVKILAAEKTVRSAVLANLKADGALGVAQPAAPDPLAEAAKGAESLPVEDKAKIAWDKSPELRKEFGENFDSYLAFEKHKGSIRIFNRKQE
jgi:signal peptide peptidase SppA